MNIIKTITVGFLAVTLTIGGILINKNSHKKQSVYTPRDIENGGVYGQKGYAEYMYLMKADPATGKIDYSLVNQVRNEVNAISKQNNKAALGLNWAQMGPDNVGGRSRAILVDRFVANRVYAGSIAGGLFVSNDGASTWTPVTGMQGVLGENLSISCITQTDNGRIFFGTGSSFDYADGSGGSGFVGNGVYEYVPSTGNVLAVLKNPGAVPNNSTSVQLSIVNAIASKGNRLYLGTKDGMVLADPDGSGFYPTTFSGWTNPIEVLPSVLEAGTCLDIDVASDGAMLVCFTSKVYTSLNDAVGSFTSSSHSGSRVSGAIAPSNPNVFYVLRSSGSLSGLEISLDKGNTWDVIVPGGSPCIDPFNQNSCDGGQGGYDDAIAVDPSDWGHILVGGVQLYEWKYQSGSNPIGGSWLKAANLFESPNNPYYVHADKHTIVWPTGGTVYIGCDGGVFKSTDGALSWQEKNYGFNVTTFYDAQTSANGWILGGAQDNGCQLFSYQSFGEPSPLGTTEISGGDGFDVAFSNQGPGVAYVTSQFGSLFRAAGGPGGTFYDAELMDVITNNNQPFHTVIENWESNTDYTSVDSVDVTFSGPDTLLAGQPFEYSSLSNGSPLFYTPTTTMFVDVTDTLRLQDYIQNRFALATNFGIYVTRDAARLNAAEIEWNRVSTIGNVYSLEFSADGNNLFVGTNGGFRRIGNLNMANDSMGLDIRSGSSVVVTSSPTIISGVVTGIAADPNNVDNLIITTGGYSNGNHVYRCTNATGAMTVTPIQGPASSSSTGFLPKMPVYDAEIDYNDNDKVMIGTEWGIWTTSNAFSAASSSSVIWTDESGNGMTHVPVYAVEQQHLRSTHCVNSGFVYLGTHGRGFYMSQDLFTAIDENDFTDFGDGNSFISNLSVYPNPLNNVGMLAFDLKQNSETKVKIYNLVGSLVKTIDLGTMTKGNHKVKFDASALSVGSYIMSLESGSERKVAKFIVTR